MPDDGTVTIWLRRLRDGDAAAAQALWEGYFRRLVGLARARLDDRHRASADEEDVALSAFASFCRGVERSAFPRLDDRDDLWQVLVLLTARKAARARRRALAQKRGGTAVHTSALGDDAALLDDVVGTEPTPEFAAEVAEEFRRLLDRLGDDDLRAIATLKLEGYTNGEIAARLGVVERTVERRLALIRKAWADPGDAA